jgi:hypothetical protein
MTRDGDQEDPVVFQSRRSVGLSRQLPRLPSLAATATALLAALAAGIASPAAAADGTGITAPAPGPLTSSPRPDLPPGGSGARRLKLIWFDHAGLGWRDFETMARQPEEIFRPIGVQVSSRPGEDGSAYDPEAEIPVILLARDPAPGHDKAGVMGVVLRDQEPARAIWVYLSNVRRAVGQDPRIEVPPTPRESLEMARAVGRVVAHELVHVVNPEAPHARDGLMRTQLGRSFLVSREASLDPSCRKAFLAGLAERTITRAARERSRILSAASGQ